MSQRRDSRVWSVHGTTDPGPPVISGTVGRVLVRDVGAHPRLAEDRVRRGDRAPADPGECGRGGEAADGAVIVGMPAEDLRRAAGNASGQGGLALGDGEQQGGDGKARTERLRDGDLADHVLARLGLPWREGSPRGLSGPREQVRADGRGDGGRRPGGMEARLAAGGLEAVGTDAGQAGGREPDAAEADQRALRALVLARRDGLHDDGADGRSGRVDDEPGGGMPRGRAGGHRQPVRSRPEEGVRGRAPRVADGCGDAADDGLVARAAGEQVRLVRQPGVERTEEEAGPGRDIQPAGVDPLASFVADPQDR